jgi:RHS repeat-associated protein
VSSFTNERGQTRTYHYFDDDNLNYVAYANPSVTPTNVFQFDPNYNRLTGMQDGSGVTLFAYNPITTTPTIGAGRLNNIRCANGYDYILYTYDALGRVKTETLTNTIFTGGNSVYVYKATYTYDTLGRVTGLASNNLNSFSYNYVGASPRLSSIVYPFNRQTTVFDYYNAQGDFRLKAITNFWTNSVLSRFNYVYSQAGQITTWTKQFAAQTPITNTLGYDAVGELTSIVSKQGATTKTYGYGYDLAGNRTSENYNGSLWRAWFDPLNQLAGKDQGLSSSSRTYRWDEESRLVAVTNGTSNAQIVYDAFGQVARVAERQAGSIFTNYFVWSLGKIIEEGYINTNSQISPNWYYPHGFVGWNNGFQVGAQITYDHLGTPHELTDVAGFLDQRWDFDAFGRYTNLANNFNYAYNFGFCSAYVLPGVGLNLATYRAYDPDLGRWMSRDPIGEVGGLNVYRYVRNDPVNQIDPDGLCPQQGFAGGPGQFRDPNSGLIRDSSGNAVRDQLNPLNPLNFKGENSLNRGTGEANRPPESPFYSVAFEAKLRPGTLMASDANHFRQANRQLYQLMQEDAELAQMLESHYPGIGSHVTPGARGGIADTSPPGLTWHHDPRSPGNLQLVPRTQHQAPGPVQNTLHPGQQGGRELWGGGR